MLALLYKEHWDLNSLLFFYWLKKKKFKESKTTSSLANCTGPFFLGLWAYRVAWLSSVTVSDLQLSNQTNSFCEFWAYWVANKVQLRCHTSNWVSLFKFSDFWAYWVPSIYSLFFLIFWEDYIHSFLVRERSQIPKTKKTKIWK